MVRPAAPAAREDQPRFRHPARRPRGPHPAGPLPAPLHARRLRVAPRPRRPGDPPPRPRADLARARRARRHRRPLARGAARGPRPGRRGALAPSRRHRRRGPHHRDRARDAPLRGAPARGARRRRGRAARRRGRRVRGRRNPRRGRHLRRRASARFGEARGPRPRDRALGPRRAASTSSARSRTARFSASALRAAGLDAGATHAVARAAKQLSRACKRTVDAPRDTEAAPLRSPCWPATPTGSPGASAPARARLALAAGGSAELAETSVVRDAEWLVALDAEERPRAARAAGSWSVSRAPSSPSGCSISSPTTWRRPREVTLEPAGRAGRGPRVDDLGQPRAARVRGRRAARRTKPRGCSPRPRWPQGRSAFAPAEALDALARRARASPPRSTRRSRRPTTTPCARTLIAALRGPPELRRAARSGPARRPAAGPWAAARTTSSAWPPSGSRSPGAARCKWSTRPASLLHRLAPAGLLRHDRRPPRRGRPRPAGARAPRPQRPRRAGHHRPRRLLAAPLPRRSAKSSPAATRATPGRTTPRSRRHGCGRGRGSAVAETRAAKPPEREASFRGQANPRPLSWRLGVSLGGLAARPSGRAELQNPGPGRSRAG